MKKIHLIITLAALMLSVNAQAQEDRNMFNHMSVGLNAGTPGIGFDVAMPISDHFAVRAGVAFMPKLKFDIDLDVDMRFPDGAKDKYGKIPEEIKAEGKLGFTNGMLIFDYYPSTKVPFFISAGAYFGSSKIAEAYNKERGVLKGIAEYNKDVRDGVYAGQNAEEIGALLGEYLLKPDDDGNVEACIKTAGFKPYLGVGFGRAVPKKRVACRVDIGAMFWGSPKIYCQGHQLTTKDVEGEGGEIIKTVSKISVYPVINFRLCGRIF